MTGFYTLLRAHDIIWDDKQNWPFLIRVQTCELLWRLALDQALHPVGSASTAEQSESLADQVDAALARRRQ